MKDIFWDCCLFLAILCLFLIASSIHAQAKGPPSVWITTVEYVYVAEPEPYYPPGYFQGWSTFPRKPRDGICDTGIRLDY